MRQSPSLWLGRCVAAFLFLIDFNATGWATSQSQGLEVRQVTEVFEFRPGVLVDSSQSSVYLMNQQGGIDAVDLRSGERLWTTSNAAKPLLLEGRHLVAQTEPAAPSNSLRIAILNTQRAGELLFEASVQLPEEVQVAIQDGLGTTFRTSARLHEDDAIVSWRFSQQEISGTPDDPNREPRVTAGAVRIDLETGHADSLGSDEVPPPPRIPIPDGVARLETPPEPLWQIGDVLATVTRTSRGERTLLRRWNRETGQALPEIVLFGGELTFRSISVDGRHLLGSSLLDSGGSVWLWRPYSLETGEQVAQVRNASPGALFFLTVDSLIHEAPPTSRTINGRVVMDQLLRLRAIDLETSEERWEWPFRDTRYRGAYPPSRGVVQWWKWRQSGPRERYLRANQWRDNP